MRPPKVAVVLAFLLTASCVGVGSVRPAGAPAPQATTQPAPQPETPLATLPIPLPATRSPAPGTTTTTKPASPAKLPAKLPANLPPQPSAKPPTSIAVAPVPTPKARVPVAPVAARQPPTPPLNLASLEVRLRDTKAIGVFTKISLKNQVDDLLNRFRAYYKRQARTTLAELRRPYDMLLLKVLSLLQNGDPPLARDIVASREAIWGILANPEKFNEAKLMAGETP